MKTMACEGLVTDVRCTCGCSRIVAVPTALLENELSNRVKDEFRPHSYSADLGGFVVSGATGYIYGTLDCLNYMNED